MTLRTKTIDEACLWTETHTGPTTATMFVEYQPGNGTRYPLLFTRLDLGPNALPNLGFSQIEEAGVVLVSWFNGATARSHAFRDEGFLHWTYVAEKFGTSPSDAKVLAEVIAHFTNREAEPAAEPTADGPPRCAACGGTGKLTDAEALEVCPECSGEGVVRASGRTGT